MRVYLTNPELKTDAGQELLALLRDIAADGKLDLDEIKHLRRWLRANRSNVEISAVAYLSDIMNRITADGVIDRDELMELHLAIERVIPTAYRGEGATKRKEITEQKQQRRREVARAKREKEKEELRAERQEQARIRNRVRHNFAKIAGVSFPNDDGTERQQIIRNCTEGEQLLLVRDFHNRFSDCATKVLRVNHQQLGHLPEYLAERLCDMTEKSMRVTAMITNITGGTRDFPTFGVNMLVLFYQDDVSSDELNAYANRILQDRA